MHFVRSSGGHPDSFLNTDDAGESTLLLPGDRANVTLHRFFRFVYVLAHVTRLLPARVAPGRVTAPDAQSYVWEDRRAGSVTDPSYEVRHQETRRHANTRDQGNARCRSPIRQDTAGHLPKGRNAAETRRCSDRQRDDRIDWRLEKERGSQ